MKRTNPTSSLLAIALVGAIMCGPALASDDLETAFSETAPSRSLSKTSSILDSLALKALLDYDYVEWDEEDGDWKTAGVPGVEKARFFTKDLGDGVYRTLELAISTYPGGSLVIHGYGVEVTPDGLEENSDLGRLEKRLKKTIDKLEDDKDSKNVERLGYEILQLSYVQSDRALGLLKALGYTTIEYKAKDGEGVWDRIYEPLQEHEWKLPVTVKLIDSPKTSLMDPFDEGKGSKKKNDDSAVPDIGGTYLHNVTSGEPQQRLLLVYDREEPESVEKILTLIQDRLDQPARQIVIEALVIEINTDSKNELGFNYYYQDGSSQGQVFSPDPSLDPFDRDEGPLASSQAGVPLLFGWDKTATLALEFSARLNALVDRGDAEILSSPKVLVLDGRQARIQVGQQVPVVTSTQTASSSKQSVDYFPVGIVLNLRPRINASGDDITMQVETIVSAVNNAASVTATSGDGVFFAPTVDNRQVQTFVRISNNTPFIIGGLISTDSTERVVGIPGLSKIPVLGALFRKTIRDSKKKEVIVVLTPHVMPIEDRSFSYVIPQDSEKFDSSGHRLFRRAYRIQSRDVYDLKFVEESEVFQGLVARVKTEARANPRIRKQAPFKDVLEGTIPGVDILVRRMLWDVVWKNRIWEHVDPQKILAFIPDSGAAGFDNERLFKMLGQRDEAGENALVLRYDADPKGTEEKPFVQPVATVSFETVDRKTYADRLFALNNLDEDGNPDNWAILISDESNSSSKHPLDVLRAVLVLKQILFLNKDMKLELNEFRVGRQVIFPTQQDLINSFHIIDRDAAQLFFQAKEYYPAFEREFNRQTNEIREALEELEED